jgi:hypothetical protein
MTASCCARVVGKGAIGEGRGVGVGFGVGVGLGDGVAAGILVGWMIAVGGGETAHVLTDVNRMMGVRMSTVAIQVIRTMMVAGFDRERERFFWSCD